MTQEISKAGNPAAPARWWLALVGLALLLGGAFLAQQVRTAGGVAVSDIRFVGADGTDMSALLYVPENATAQTPAPGILAVHGYINSRETQDGFAIEFARRGYVVLALDQTGHGYSGGKAFTNGFGGPDGLAHLRSLPMVDKDQIGLEGHSMGGWTVLAAAAAMPDAYRSMVLQGSSTGAPFAQDGTATWPRNVALVFSQYDEFSQLMWGTDRAIDVPTSDKLQAFFGSDSTVARGEVYGSIEAGTARVLYQPVTTHPGNHFSTTSIGHAADWFARTLDGGTPKPASDQIWYWKEFGTGIGLIGFVMIVLGVFDLFLGLPFFAPLRTAGGAAFETRDRHWWRTFALGTAIPALLFFPAFIAAFFVLPASPWLPQAITNQVVLWALLGAGGSLLMARFGPAFTKPAQPSWLRCILLALLTVTAGYCALWIADLLFQTDIRLWVVAVKLPSAHQWGIAAIYVVPLTLAFLVTAKTLAGSTVRTDSTVQLYGSAILTLTLGLTIMLTVIYGFFFGTGYLITAFDPLSTVVALQFVPVLAAIAVICTFAWRRTGGYRPGGILVGLLVTLYVVAGTATQA